MEGEGVGERESEGVKGWEKKICLLISLSPALPLSLALSPALPLSHPPAPPLPSSLRGLSFKLKMYARRELERERPACAEHASGGYQRRTEH